MHLSIFIRSVIDEGCKYCSAVDSDEGEAWCWTELLSKVVQSGVWWCLPDDIVK